MNNGNPMDDAFKKMFEQLKNNDPVTNVVMNDRRLTKLAEYDATEGYMKINITPDDLQSRFVKFKQLVKRGTFTLKELEDDVYKRWGITEGIIEDMDEEGKPIIGFRPESLNYADIPEDSPENH